MSSFSTPSPKPDFWQLQQGIIHFWKQHHSFEQSIQQRSGNESYRFYDGPPFITGTPHYGTLLSSILKDVIPRYQTMKGKVVERVW
jgi:isoleucyl-tRNA synthetase